MNARPKEDPYQKLWEALQAISACPHGCKCCKEHEAKMIAALSEFLNRWRP